MSRFGIGENILMRGIIAAGGASTRVRPALDKMQQLIYDKPLFYYLLTNLMKAGCQEVLVICNDRNIASAHALFLDAMWEFGVSVTFTVAPVANGPAGIFRLPSVRRFIGDLPVCLMLDDVYHGGNVDSLIPDCSRIISGSAILAAWAPDPCPFGWIRTGTQGQIIDVVEKPKAPAPGYDTYLVQAGMYFYGPEVLEAANTLPPSARGEYEVSDLSNYFLRQGKLDVKILNDTSGSPYLWDDAGTPERLLSLAVRIRDLQENGAGCLVGSPHLQAILNGWVTATQVLEVCAPFIVRGIQYYKNLAKILSIKSS